MPNEINGTVTTSGVVNGEVTPNGVVNGVIGIGKGDKGDKPVKGVDYFTEADKTELMAGFSTELTTVKAGVARADRKIESLDSYKQSKLVAGDGIELTEETVGVTDDLLPIKQTTIKVTASDGVGWSSAQVTMLKNVLYMMEFSSVELASEGKTKIDALIASLMNTSSSGGTDSGGSSSGGTDSGGSSSGGTDSGGSSSGGSSSGEEPEPTVNLTSISAVYNGASVEEGTSAESLRNNITVTAHYDNGTSETVTAWTITGTISSGSNTITIAYEGFTTTITVTGTAVQDPLVSSLAVHTFENAFLTVDDVNGFYQLVEGNNLFAYIVPVEEGTYKFTYYSTSQYGKGGGYINNLAMTNKIYSGGASPFNVCSTDMADASTTRNYGSTITGAVVATDITSHGKDSETNLYKFSFAVTFSTSGYISVGCSSNADRFQCVRMAKEA